MTKRKAKYYMSPASQDPECNTRPYAERAQLTWRWPEALRSSGKPYLLYTSTISSNKKSLITLILKPTVLHSPFLSQAHIRIPYSCPRLSISLPKSVVFKCRKPAISSSVAFHGIRSFTTSTPPSSSSSLPSPLPLHSSPTPWLFWKPSRQPPCIRRCRRWGWEGC